MWTDERNSNLNELMWSELDRKRLGSIDYQAFNDYGKNNHSLTQYITHSHAHSLAQYYQTLFQYMHVDMLSSHAPIMYSKRNNHIFRALDINGINRVTKQNFSKYL